MTSEWVAAMAAAFVSLLLEVTPGLDEWWERQERTPKRLAWLGVCLLLPMAVAGAGCVGLDVGVEGVACSWDGLVQALRVGFVAYYSGQIVHAAVGSPLRKMIRRGRGGRNKKS